MQIFDDQVGETKFSQTCYCIHVGKLYVGDAPVPSEATGL